MTPIEPKTRVWDLPTRTFHWLLVASFAGAWLTADSERTRDLHLLCGYTAAGLVVFRLLWGVIGTRWARFASFPLAPRAVAQYLRSLASDEPQHWTGHNPAGSWAILAMLALLGTLAITGWSLATGASLPGVDEVHEGLASALLALALLHVAAVVVSSLIHRENLIRAMFTGTKRGNDAPVASRWPVALVLAAATAAFLAGLIPAPGLEQAPQAASMRGSAEQAPSAAAPPATTGAPIGRALSQSKET